MKNNPLKQAIGNRRELLLLVLSAIFLAVGIGLGTSAINEFLTKYDIPIWSAASTLIILAGWGIVRTFLENGTRYIKLNGFVLYDPGKNIVFDIFRYHYSYDLTRYLNAAFKENPAFQYHWNKEPVTSSFSHDGTNGISRSSNQSIAMVREATEYWILSELSTHLTDYFNRIDKEEGKIREYSRKDIPEMLLENRFLELFSKPMKDRSGFAEDHDDDRDRDMVVAAFSDGLIFEKFDLVLPAKSKLTKTRNGLRIETPKFSLEFNVHFDAMGHNLPHKFEKLYLGIDDFRAITSYSISISVKVDFKPSIFMSSRGTEYYYWIDSFIEELVDRFDENQFFKKIQWEGITTTFECLEKMKGAQPGGGINSEAAPLRDTP